MISVIKVSKTYKTSGGDVHALQDVSIDFPETGMVFLLGKSGSGKSTLLHILGGLDLPTSGVLQIDGRDSSSFSDKEWNVFRAEKVGFVFQNFSLLHELTVGENVSLPLKMLGKPGAKEAMERALEEVELGGMSERRTSTLSGGQRQRVAIARALIKDSPLILADEPTGALDEVTGHGVFELLKKFSSTRLVIIATHDRDAALLYGDRIIELKDGAVAKDEKKESQKTELKKEAHLYRKRAVPFKVAAAIAMSALKKKRFKFATSFLLAGLSFSLFGAFAAIVTVDRRPAIYDGLQQASLPSISVRKVLNNAKEKEVFFDSYGETSYEHDVPGSKQYACFTKKEVLDLNAKGINVAGIFALPSDLSFSSKALYVREPLDVYYPLEGGTLFSSLSDCGASFCNQHFELLYGHYPETKNEIAISSYKAETLLHSLDYEKNSIYSSLADIVGSTLALNRSGVFESEPFTISAIYKTNEIPAEFDALKSFSGYNDLELLKRFMEYKNNTFLDVGFVSDSFYDEYIGRYDRERRPLESVFTYGNIELNSILADETGKESIGRASWSIGEVIPSYFVKKHGDQFTLLNVKGEPLSITDLSDGEILISSDIARTISNGKYDALSQDVQSLKKSYYGLSASPVLCSKEAYDLFNEETFKENVKRVASYDSFGGESRFVEDAYNSVEDFVATWFEELQTRMFVLDSSYWYGYSHGEPKNQYVDKLYQEYLSSSEYATYKNLSSKINGFSAEEDYLSVSEEEWQFLLNNAKKNFNRIEGVSRALSQYSFLMPFSAAEQYLADLPNSAEAKAIAKRFNDRFAGDHSALCSAFLSGELSEEDREDLAKTFILSASDESAMGNYEYGHFPRRAPYGRTMGLIDTETGRTLKTVGVISSHGTGLGSCIVANPKTLESLGLAIASGSSIRYVVSDYEYRGEGKYSSLLSLSTLSRSAIYALNESHGSYSYETTDPVSENVMMEMNKLGVVQVVFVATGALLAVFSSFLLANFIANSARDKEKDIGILRSLGAGKTDVFKTFLIEAFATSIASSVLANILGAIIVAIINHILFADSMYGIVLYRYGFGIVLTVFGVSLLISFLASLGPILGICRKEVVDAVRCEE